MAAISNTPGVSGAGNIPSAGEMNAYAGKLDKMNTKELYGELGKNLEPWQKDAVEKAIIDKAQQSGGGQGAGGAQGAGGPSGAGDNDDDADELKKLIEKLLKKLGNGSISHDEMQKLADVTGAKMEDLEGAKGQGAGGGGGGDSQDIQGG